MTATSTGVVNLGLALLTAVVVLGIALGAVDVVRQPGWAWRAAGEPKLLSLTLVLLLPGVGLAIYVFGARPKVLAVASAGRAANLPFERFGDRVALATESTRSIQALYQPTTIGSFGERRTARVVRTSDRDVVQPERTGFFEDPDLVTVGEPTGTVDPVEPPMQAATASAQPPIRIPGSLGRPYHPKQRAAFEGDESFATVAAQIFGATEVRDAGSPVPPTASVTAAPARPASPSVGAVPNPQATGPTFAATPPHGSGPGLRQAGRAPSDRRAATQLTAAPVATPGTPEIFRPRPERVAPIAAAPTSVATVERRATMAARWLPDPTGRHQYRYWDGGSWTENVYDAGVESRDAVTN